MFCIIEPNPKLQRFINRLDLSLSVPQHNHLVRLTDALISVEGSKTLAALNRALREPTDQSALSDFLTYSPWSSADVRHDAMRYIVQWVTSAKCSPETLILISIDDSLAKKPCASKHFEPAEWHFEANGQRQYGYGAVIVDCHIRYGHRSTIANWRLYMREKTVRRLNRHRPPSDRLRFRTKFQLAVEMLQDIQPLLPQHVPVYVLFDSWYASNKLIRFCRAQQWHVICAIKSNRCLNGKRLARIARYKRNKSFRPVWVNSVETATKYFACSVVGQLNGLKGDVRVIMSKRHNRDKRPKFFMSTDTSVGIRKGLTRYSARWEIEVDHLYVKLCLGLEAFRVRSVEGIKKYFTAAFLALAYLQWRRDHSRSECTKRIADVIYEHRREHDYQVLQAFGEEVLRLQAIQPAIKTFLS